MALLSRFSGFSSCLALAALAASTPVFGQVTITSGSTPTYNSNGLFDTAANGRLTFDYSGPAFPIGSIRVTGRLTKAANSDTLMEQTRIGLDTPLGARLSMNTPLLTGAWPVGGVIQPTAVTRKLSGGTTSQAASATQLGIIAAPAVLSPGQGALRFYETVNDGGDLAVDARWTNLNITINPVVRPTLNVTDLGDLSSPSTDITTTTDASAPVQWFRFRISSDAAAANARFIDFTTRQSGAEVDTALALFRASDGALLSVDDEGGAGSYSQLSFGQSSPTRTTGAAYAGSVGGDGRNGALPAGEYFLAASHYTAFLNTAGTALVAGAGFEVASPTAFGGFILNVSTNVPAPSSVALIGVAAVVARRRRR